MKHDKWLLLSGFAVLSTARLCLHFCGMFQLYHDYFLWLCQLHPSLAHSDTQRVFEMVSVEEALGDFRGKVSSTGFYFRLVDYTWGVGEKGGFQFQKKQGAFIVGKKIAVRDAPAAARITARNQCETICNDFISHMIADSRNGHPLFSNQSDELSDLKINVQPLLPTGDGSYEGLICTFEFFPEKDYTLACHPVPEWQELSPSTYDGTPPTPPSYWQLGDGGFWST